MSSHYAAGTRFEREVRTLLQEEGYDVVRSAGSKSKIDLVAIKTGEILLIQCKVNGKISPAERIALIRLARAAGPTAVPIVAMKVPSVGIAFDWLTGPGPKDRAPWATDEIAEAQ